MAQSFAFIILYSNNDDNTTFSKTHKHKNLKNVSSNLLNSAFLSKENVSIIQNQIRHSVWSKSNHQFVIAPQSETQIEIMRHNL